MSATQSTPEHPMISSTIVLSKYLCPICDKPLAKIVDLDGQPTLWCGAFRCDSFEANQPETAETEELAYQKLVVRVREREGEL